jgi:hypothetical protein
LLGAQALRQGGWKKDNLQKKFAPTFFYPHAPRRGFGKCGNEFSLFRKVIKIPTFALGSFHAFFIGVNTK